ncbi:MAG: PepSY domain-containing protein [Ignavibacteria bacterium]|nr:PepSY domain-containing protein [Ignavibacteria bacterium]
MKLIIAVLAIALSVSTGVGQKKMQAKITKEQATKTALEQVKEGIIQSTELEKEKGMLIWSFDIKSGNEVKEVWIDANTGKYLKTETESATHENAEKATDNAEKAALKKVPGEILKSEVEHKKGKTMYVFEIKSKDGKMTEVEVDAKTNRVTEMSTVENEKEKDEEDEE